jgi:hypothetical protein
VKSIPSYVVLVLSSYAAFAQAPAAITDEDRAEIEALAAGYAAALGSCDAAAFADLFDSKSGYFASGFRGRISGRKKLIALVDSERHCQDAQQGSRRSFGVPPVSVQVDGDSVRGVADLGAAGQYQDEYVRTARGWRFASRSVLTPAEIEAGLDAGDLAAIRGLSADLKPGDHYERSADGGTRFLSSGVVISVDSGTVHGRVYLDGGGYYDDVYEMTSPGKWRIVSRNRVSPE